MLNDKQWNTLNDLSDGGEPFSVIHLSREGVSDDSCGINETVEIIFALLEMGFIRFEPDEQYQEVSISICEFKAFYDKLKDEIAEKQAKGEKGFYYSKGEIFFEMTEKGREEWGKECYKIFYKQ